MNFTKYFNSIRILTALAFYFVVGASTLGAQVMCGDTIMTSAKLTANLTCTGDAGPAALTVMGPGGKLNLNGFTLNCDNATDATDTDGILLTGSKARAFNGTVTDCTNGVVLNGTGRHHVAGITSEDNSEDGFLLTMDSDGNNLNGNTAQRNGDSGFRAFRSDDNHFSGNLADGNNTVTGFATAGFFIRGSGNQLNGNTSRDNLGRGIFVDRAGPTTIHSNTVVNNRFQEIELSVGAGGNFVTSNIVDANGTGHHGILVGNPNNRVLGNIVTGAGVGIGTVGVMNATDNLIQGNDSTGNSVKDLRDVLANCDNNTWKDNTFVTSNQGCIN